LWDEEIVMNERGILGQVAEFQGTLAISIKHRTPVTFSATLSGLCPSIKCHTKVSSHKIMQEDEEMDPRIDGTMPSEEKRDPQFQDMNHG
jgi:hypothetical protein